MPERGIANCFKCGREPGATANFVCPICGKTVCLKCSHFGYGRYFCSYGCAEYFFHGDAEENEFHEEG